MNLRTIWLNEVETPQLMELAPIDRYKAAGTLFRQSEWDAAIYLYGYVSEMVLKTSFFRSYGCSQTSSTKSILSLANQFALTQNKEGYHSILFWKEALINCRQQFNKSLEIEIQSRLNFFGDYLYNNWMVEMRYHPNKANKQISVEVAEAATWLFEYRTELGS